MKKFGVVLRDLVLLAMVILVSCGEDEPDPVKPEEVDEVVDLVGNCLPGKSSLWSVTSEKDGVEMMLIPAGCLLMGDHFDDGQNDEFPVHVVELDAFYMDVYEVTVGQFKQFVEESGYVYDRWNDVARYSPEQKHPMING